MKKMLLIRIINTLLGWVIAFMIVYTMIFFFGEKLKAYPPVVTALIFSGVLVTVMGNFVMPFLSRIVIRYFDKKYL